MKHSASLIALFSLLFSTVAQSSDDLLAAVEEEQEAFEEGDCDKVESMMAEDITFYANGRKMSREQVGRFCRSIKRPFGAGRAPIEDETTPYLIDEDLGYTVRDFWWHDESERIVHEVVTKIWAKDEDGWKMIHFQSTVMPEKRSRRQP